MGFIGIAIMLIIFSCNKGIDVKPGKSSKELAKYDTITSLDKMATDTAIWKFNGQCNMVTHEASTDEEFETEDNTTIETDNDNDNSSLRASGCSSTFAGSARATAKKSFAIATYVTYPTIASVRASMQTDTYMRSIGITTSSPRKTQEQRNVSITSAYLYAISRESDNDLHMIIGDGTASPTTLLNCECGGLPSTTSTSYAAMKAVRDYLKSYFGTDFCGTSGYTHFAHPVHITILKGSLFYDIDHGAGTVGPTGYRANTSWEMHPISSIKF